ncbi:carbohydrate porin [Obesumbacterium proteus]|uniref:carbohydrate porin n=1 Tax=Obesumbacterium proteus TaxID=82983 RepID=UPI00242FCB27|nr:carbohydrate porin [Obesumbacterium proteus]
MIVKNGLLLCIGAFSSSLYAQSHLTLEQRISQLEERLIAAEKRAGIAEAEIKTLKNKPAENNKINTDITNNKNTSEFIFNQKSKLKFYGDVEFNLDSASRTGSLTSLKTNANKKLAPSERERWDVNGRILLGVDGVQHSSNGKYAGFTVQPLADMNGKMNLDDAAFYFGKENDWLMKVGRFEAYDMFPLNQDTFVEYSGNTANDLYSDGYGYIYMMKEARGRSNSGGNLLVSKTLDNWYLELNTLVEDGSSLFVDQRYHGEKLDNKKNVVYFRPVVSWRSSNYSLAAAMETNAVNNAYGYTDSRGRWQDTSERTGYGLTMTWNFLRANPQDGMVVNLNTAMMDAKDERDFSAGINALWHRVELGYIYAHNKISNFNVLGVNGECGNDCAILAPGKYDIHTIHSSWQVPDIMNMPNFNIYLGAYASWLNSSAEEDSSNQPRYGARLRFKYLF